MKEVNGLIARHFSTWGLYPALESRTARNLVGYLLRQGFDRFASSKGLKQYSLSNKRKFHWFPQGLVDGDKIHE